MRGRQICTTGGFKCSLFHLMVAFIIIQTILPGLSGDLSAQYTASQPELWLTPTSDIVQTEGLLEEWWSDDHVLFVAQPEEMSRPAINPSEEQLAGKRTVVFSGESFLQGSMNFGQPITIFSVFRPESNASAFLYDTPSRLFINCLTNNTIKPSLLNEYASPVPNDYFIITTHELEDDYARFFENGVLKVQGVDNRSVSGYFRIGASAFSDRFLQGSVAEIIIYSTILDDAERAEVIDSLKLKYAPPPELGDNLQIIPGCSKSLSVDNRFKEYSWYQLTETGEEILLDSDVFEIEITEPGTYKIETLSIFNDVLTDTVTVELLDLEIPTGTVCEGFAFEVNSGVVDDSLSIQWSDTSLNGPIVVINSPGSYSVTVSQSDGCILTEEFDVLEIDEMAEVQVPEIICVGNPITIKDPEADGLNILWNTGSTAPIIIPENEGLYWAEVTNQNGCVGTDTILIEFAGVAPQVQYSVSQYCAETELTFTDDTAPEDGSQITNTQWIIGNDTLQGEAVSYSFIDHGNYPIQLSVLTDVGCTGFLSDVIEIHPLPEVAFGHGLPCNNQVTLFEDESTIAEGNLSTWLWDFGNGNTAITPVAAASFPDPGTQEVSLTVTSAEGCAQTITETIEVWPSPVAAFDWSQTCEGNMMYLNSLTDTSLTGSVNYAWNLNDIINYPGASIQHSFSEPGNYPVTHQVWTIINGSPGCFHEVTQLVTVSAIPAVQFQTEPACTGEEFMLYSQTEAGANDTIISWHWSTGGTVMDSTASTTWVFDELGSYPVTLAVETQAGCSAEATQNVVVGLSDQPVIAFTPEIGLPPVDVQFTNETSYGQSHFWEFGDGGFSEEESPEYTYQDTGNYIVSLFVFDEAGCSGFASVTFQAVEPYFDVAVVEVSSTLVGNQMSASCVIANYNNHRLTTADISISLGNGTVVTEKWSGDLARDQMTSYTFQSQLTVDPEISEPYTCIEISNPNKNILDAVLSNNRMCKSFSTKSFEVFNPFPNPAVERVEQWFHLERAGTVKIRMVQADGRTLFEQEDNFASGLNKVSIGTGSFSAGLYVIELEWNSRVEWRRVLIGK